MLITSEVLKKKLSEYSNKNNKISREIKNGNLIRIVNGLYETDKHISGYLLASSIYGPSYLSFDYALYYYGLIPEKVTTYTSATFEKKKKKQYKNFFGIYTYRDVPSDIYFLGVKLIEENGYTYQIATPEKALCDKLYIISPMRNMKELENLLFNDLRIDIEVFNKLNATHICELSEVYPSTNVRLLYKYIRRNIDE